MEVGEGLPEVEVERLIATCSSDVDYIASALTLPSSSSSISAAWARGATADDGEVTDVDERHHDGPLGTWHRLPKFSHFDG